jgi:hypothetical protein
MRVTMDAMKTFYSAAGLELSEEDCRDAMKAFTGNELTFTLDFEIYVINMERWARKVQCTIQSVTSLRSDCCVMDMYLI